MRPCNSTSLSSNRLGVVIPFHAIHARRRIDRGRVTGAPGAVSGPCRPRSRSSRPPLFAPPASRPVARPQIPACSFPAPDSCRRANTIVGLAAADPQARCFSDMLHPARSPEHALLLAFPSTGCLPSNTSAAESSRLCSMLHRYYAAVRLLTPSSTALSPRLPVATRDRRGDRGRE